MAFNVLIADDDAHLINIISRLLGSSNIQVVGLQYGDEVIEYLDHTLPNVLLLDIGLPEVDGLEILQYIHQAGYTDQMYIIVLTAYANLARSDEAAIANQILIKPVDVRDVVALIKDVLSN